MVTKTCPICRTVFTCSTNRVYCSDECAKKNKRMYGEMYRDEKRGTKKPVKRNTGDFLSIDEVVKRARELGMSYGEYMVKYGEKEMKVLICKENENFKKSISLSGVSKELGSERCTQRVIIQKAGYRLCVLYSEIGEGKQSKIRLADGDTLTVRGTYIICREEYGAYGDISKDDICDVMLMLED